MPTTGDTCTQSGIYTGRCNNGHSDSAHFKNGTTFTPCATCGGDAKKGGAVMNWTLSSAKG
jgi:hypothetical protein